MISNFLQTNSSIGPSSDIGSIWDAAVAHYEATTNIKIQTVDGPRTICEILDESKQQEALFLNHRHDKSRVDKLRSLISRTLAPIEMWGDIVTNATKTLFPPAEIIFAAVRYLISTANTTSADFDRVEEFFGTLTSYLTQLQIWEHNLPAIPQLEEVITEVFTSVLVLCGICTKYIKTRRLLKAFRALAGEDNELKSALDRFQRTILKEQSIVRNATLAGVQRIDKGNTALHVDVRANRATMDKLVHKTEDAIAVTNDVQTQLISQESALERDKIVAWLSRLVFDEKQKDTHMRHYDGTCRWFFDNEQFKKWFHGMSNTTLWCSGIPGAGKSVMTSVVISHIEDRTQCKDVAIAYVYCDYKNPDTQSEIELISSITRQLVEQSRPIPPRVKTYRNKWMEKRSFPTCVDRISLIQDIISLFNRVYIFVDALDECPEDNRQKLLYMLKALEPSVRLFITSRPYLDLHAEFSEISRIDITADRSDIQTFLESEINSNKRMSLFVAKDAKLKSDIINTIVEKADGMFLVAHLQIALLCRKTSLRKVRDSLDTLPTEVYDFYEEALARIEDQPEDDRELAKRALAFIFCARRPLTMEELRHALSICPNDTNLDETAFPEMEIILNISIGLIRVDESHNVVELVHHTLQEYLNKYPSKVICQPGAELATACLSYLSLDVFQNGPCVESHALEQRLQKYRFYGYASEYCGSHLNDDQNHECTNLLKELLAKEQKLASCMQVLYIPRGRNQGWQDRYPKQFSPLHLVALWGTEWCLSLLSQEGIDIHSRDSHGDSALQLAARRGHLVAVQLLSRKGARADTRNYKGETALHWAARNGHKTVVDFLLIQEADVMAQDFEGWSSLDWAVIGGHAEIVKLLLDCCVALDPENVGLNKALTLAAEAGNEAIVQMILNTGVDVDQKDHMGSTALAWAVPAGHEQVSRILLVNRADVNSKDNYGNTVLHWSLPYPGIARMLIDKGAEVDTKNNTGQTALIWSAQDGQETALQLLLDNKASVLAQDNHGCTALHAAALKGHEVIVDILVRNGADPDTKDKDGWTALHAAALRQHTGIVSILIGKTSSGSEITEWVASQQKEASKRALLAHMADTKSEGSSVVSALGSAAQEGQFELVQALLETGVDIDGMDGCGSTALTLATWQEHENIVRLILEQGADVNKRERSGRSALHLASEYGCYRIVQLLVEKGIHINEEVYSWTPLLIAAERGHDTTIEYLVRNGANVNAEDYYGRRALHWTAWYGYRMTVQSLIKKGADVNAADRWGRTPLMYAIEGNEVAVVELLLRIGANVELKTEANATPLHLASYIGNRKIVSLLLGSGADKDSTTQNGYNALHIATLFKHEDVKQLLLTENATDDAWPKTRFGGQEDKEDMVHGYMGTADVDSLDRNLRAVICMDKRINRCLMEEAVVAMETAVAKLD